MSETAIEKLLFVLLGVILSAAGFLAKRYLQGAHANETLDRKQKVLTIHDTLVKLGLGAADLGAIERNLLGSTDDSTPKTTDSRSGASDELLDALVNAKTQAEMNQISGERARRADFELEQALQRLRGKTITAVRPLVDIVQKAWFEYRRQQVEVVGHQYEGGSIQPFIRNSEYESLTRRRVTEVESMIKNVEMV